MPRKIRLGAKVLKAVSSPLRLEILRLLNTRGNLSYTEIMNHLKLSPTRDAGRFAYHLKTLLKMDLIEPDAESKRYGLTGLGKTVVEFADELDESAFKKRLMVRTSRFAIEDFDGNKIAESLVREADVPSDLAQKIAKETERRLLKLDTKYLTAPLIREFVNSVLIERGLEEYRHKLTRLGFPVYDVTQLIKKTGAKAADVEAIHESAGNRVLEEYTLLNVLPRDIADAHLAGALNLNNLGSWILKIDTIMHDLRFFIKHGLRFRTSYPQRISIPAPKSFRSMLVFLADILRLCSSEVKSEQVVDYFNIFLAPYAEGLSKEELKEDIRIFLASINISSPTGISLGLEIAPPDWVRAMKVSRTQDNTECYYGDFLDEGHLLATALLECLDESVKSKPLLNPSFIIKARREVFGNSESEGLFRKAHELALHGLPYFANLSFEGQQYASYAATGVRLADDWKKDWELDTLGTGCVDHVSINLARAMFNAEKDQDKFLSNVYDLTEKALRALEIKYQTMKIRAREGLLPFLIQKGGQDPYYILENSLRLISLIGLSEMAELFTGESFCPLSKAFEFSGKTLEYVDKISNDYSKKYGARCGLSMMPESEALTRLADLDIEKYGLSQVRLSNDFPQSCYADLSSFTSPNRIEFEDFLNLEEKIHSAMTGSHLSRIPFLEDENADDLFSKTKKIMSRKIGLYTFDTGLSYCSSCSRTFRGIQSKCPTCGSINALTKFARTNAKYRAKSS